MNLNTAFEKLFAAFEAVETIVDGCSEQFGITLVRPRKLVLYRKRLEPFLEQAGTGPFPPGAVRELWEISDALEDPEPWIENLKMASIHGKGMTKFRAFQSAYEQFRDTCIDAVNDIEDEDIEP